MSKVLHIQLLGGFRVSYGDALVETLSSPRLQSLLVYLLLHRDAPQSRRHVAFTFWPDSTEVYALSNLRKSIFRLRRALPDADRFLQIESQSVGWQPDAPFTLDVAALEAALARADDAAQAGDLAEAGEAMDRAIELYRGDLLPSCYDDWILPVREQLRQALLEALEPLIALLEQEREYRQAIAYARHLLQLDPLHEATYRTLMRLHALNGDRAGALRAYHTCATVLRRELDVEPSPDTRQTYERLLRAETPAEPVPSPTATLVEQAPLVGRQREWVQLQEAWHRAAAGWPRLALIAGDAGIGKTRLAEELTRWVRRQGHAVAVAHCYAAAGELGYAPVASWLRALSPPPLEPAWLTEVARLLPELLSQHPDLPSPRPMTEAWQRQRLFEALARATLGSARPLLLVLDDLQWCDAETRHWLLYLLNADRRAQLLVLATLRLGEVGGDDPLTPWLQALRHEGQLVEVELGPLDEAETLSLAANVAGRELDPDLAAQVYRETEGNPLFVVETVRAGLPWRQGEPLRLPQALPPRLQGAIETRLAQLSSPAREVSSLAATIGREFTYPVLAQASALDQETLIRALDELWGRRIVREQGGEGYDFTHDRLREVAYAVLTEARRRWLHVRVAQALEAVHARDLGPVSAKVGAHYQRAGSPAQAVSYYLRAAEVARQRYANEEAAEHYGQVLALSAGSSTAQERGWREEALAGLGQVHLLASRPQEAETCLRGALALGRELGRDSRGLARLHYWLGYALFGQGRYQEMIDVGERGRALLGDDGQSVEVALMNDIMALAYRYLGEHGRSRDCLYGIARYLGRLPYAPELATTYQRIIQAYTADKDIQEAKRWALLLEGKAAAEQDLEGWSVAKYELGRSLAYEGDLRSAVAEVQRALELATQAGAMGHQSQCLLHLGLTPLELGELARAKARALQALAVAGQLGTSYAMPWAHWLFGLVLLCEGADREAEANLAQAVARAHEIGSDALEVRSRCLLGEVYLERGTREEALRQLQAAAAVLAPYTPESWGGVMIVPYFPLLADMVRGLQRAYEEGGSFETFCRRYRKENAHLADSPFVQWSLQPSEPLASPQQPIDLALVEQTGGRLALAPGWTWYDPFSDCHYEVQDGLSIEAAHGRDLWYTNRSAPRLLRPLSRRLDARSPLTVQTTCWPFAAGRPALGGLLLWVDRDNYLRLDRETGGWGEVALLGCLEGRDAVVGRGLLSPEARLSGEGSAPSAGKRPRARLDHVDLRLELCGERVRGLCSMDGARWFSVGEVAFPITAEAQVGVYAIGAVDRTLYHGAYAEGAAIRFQSFLLWEG